MCRCQSIADLSRVVSFFAFVGPGRGASAVFGLRGPGLLIGGLGAHDEPDACSVEVMGASTMGFKDDESAMVASVPTGVDTVTDSVSGAIDAVVETVSSSRKEGSFHKGHFFASGESSGTSTTSLESGPSSAREQGEGVGELDAHHILASESILPLYFDHSGLL